jgi:serine/threonine protein kinase
MKESATKQKLESKYDVRWDRPLGEGGFGAVYLGTEKKTGELVAVKKISKRYTNDTRYVQQQRNHDDDDDDDD